jgi:hypothetical protein
MAIWESCTLAAVSKALMIGDIEVKLVSPPPEHAPVVALFAANVAGGGDALEHLCDGFGFGLFLDSSLSLS